MPPSELCVVGDADQSIYAFRGATIRNIEDFERDFPNATTILLEQNYRSTQNILSAANSVISRNANRREKRLWTDDGDGELIVGYVADNEHDEARFVAGEIDALADPGGDITYNDVAVFYRTNNSSRSLEEVFIRAGIPYKVVGGVRFYERKEIRDIVAYLRVLDNPGDAVSLRRILNTPRRGIGDRAEACVAVYAENTGATFADALTAAAAGQGADAQHPLGEGDRQLRQPARRPARPARRRTRRPGRGGPGPHRLPQRAGIVQRSAGPGPAGQPQRIGQRRTRIQHRPGQRRRASGGRRRRRRRGRPGDRCARRVPGTGVAGGRLRRAARARLRRGHPDDPAHRQGAGVPGRLRHRLGGRHVPAHAGAGRSRRAFRGTPVGLRRHHPCAPTALPHPRQGPLVVGPADAQPRIPLPARDSRASCRLAPHRSRHRRSVRRSAARAGSAPRGRRPRGARRAAASGR